VKFLFKYFDGLGGKSFFGWWRWVKSGLALGLVG